MYKQDLALYNLQGLICHKNQLTGWVEGQPAQDVLL